MFEILKNSLHTNNKSIILFIVLSLMYVGLEVYFNQQLFHQMSSMTSFTDIHHIENMGKTISGLGISLLILKFIIPYFQSFMSFILAVIIVSIIGIIISFQVQNAIIKSIVYGSNNEQMGKALLISKASNSIVPYYDDRGALFRLDDRQFLWKIKFNAWWNNQTIFINPENLPENITSKINKEKIAFYALAQGCLKSYNNPLMVHSSLEKAFFSYVEYSKPFDEKRYLEPIKGFTKCLFKDENFFKQTHIEFNFKSNLNNYFTSYQAASDKYNEARKKAEKAHYWGRIHINDSQKEIDKEWKSEMEDILGSGRTIPPNLDKDRFFKNNQVRRMIVDKTDQSEITHPDTPDFQKKYIRTLPDTLLNDYKEFRPYISEYLDISAQKGKKERFRFGQIINARESYKATVMPIVALSFSVTFLVLNLVSLTGFLVFGESKLLSRIFLIACISILLIIPQIKPSPVLLDKLSIGAVVVKTVYYYQGILTRFYK